MNNAFNPYQSFVITASAGSGKTYQLIQRYLHLASVLEDKRLSRILTVTFTRKAAAEMQQRIIEGAAWLLSNPGDRLLLETHIKEWSGGQARPSALKLANHILRHSQSMRVVTMDSLFSWLTSRFSVEAGLPVPSEIATASQLTELAQTAWLRLLSSPECQVALEKAAELLEGELQTIKNFLENLYQGYRPTLHLHYQGEVERMKEELTLQEIDDYSREMLEKDLWDWLERLLSDLPRNTPRQETLAEEIEKYLRKKDFAGLLSSQFFKPTKQAWSEEDQSEIVFSVNRSVLREGAQEIDEFLGRYYLTQRVKRYNQLVRSLLELYKSYEVIMAEVKKKHGLVDFADISVGAFRLLQDPGIAFTLQSGIQHLLIDEFQDTSRLQWEIFRPVMEELLSGRGIFDQQSFFAVGDIKQSIYGFREADYTLLGDLSEEAKGSSELNLLPLHRSFRSNPLIIDFVNAVFKRSGLPDFKEHETAIIPLGGSVSIYPLISEEEGGSKKGDRWRLDAARIADSIKKLIEKKVQVADKIKGEKGEEYRQRPVIYGDIAVLYRKKRSSPYLEAELTRRGIPCRRDEPGGFYQRREVQDLLALLDFLCDPGDSLALSTVLRSPLIGLSEEEFASLLNETGGTKSLWETFRRTFRGEQSKILENAVIQVARRPIAEVVEFLLQATNARLRYQVALRDDLPVLNLDKMVDLLAGLSARGVNSIRECHSALQKMSEEDETRMAGEAGNCVRLMTIHKAKGLEFKVLYLFDAGFTFPGVGKDSNFVLLRKRPSGTPPVIYFPPVSCRPNGHPVFDAWKDEAEKEARDEELRILYVALTRASQHLFISGVVPGRGEAAFYDQILAGAREVAAGERWEVSQTDHAAQPVEVALSDPTVLPPLEEVPALTPEKVEEKIFTLDGRKQGAVFLRPSDAFEKEVYPDALGEETLTVPEKFRVLGLAVHRALEFMVKNKPFSPKECIDGLMEKKHPDRDWVEKELQEDLKRMKTSEIFSRLQGAKVKTEVSILDYLAIEEEDDRIVTGVIALLAVFPDRVEFYNYKTTRLKEGMELSEAEKFHSQMELYAKTLSDIYPVPVSGYLVFTATGKIIKIV